MSLISKIKEKIPFKKFLFLLHLETGGLFINSYCFTLSMFALLCSFFVASVIVKTINAWWYVGAIFMYITLMVLSLIAMKGLETNHRVKISLGFIPTVSWALIFFSAVIAQFFYKFHIGDPVSGYLLTSLDVTGSMLLFFFIQLYFIAYYIKYFMTT